MSQQQEEGLGKEYDLLQNNEYGFKSQSKIKPYQYFLKYTIQPFNNKYRYLVQHGTGLGKTFEALLIAKNWINQNRQIIILTFNRDVFENEIIKHGVYIGLYREVLQQQYKQHPLDQSIRFQILKEALKNIQIMGYRHFQLQFAKQPNIVQEGSLIICDESHQLYNKEERNNWGQTILMVSYTLKEKVTIVYFTATPLNNPDEIKDLQSLINDDFPNMHAKDIEQQLKYAQNVQQNVFSAEQENKQLQKHTRIHEEIDIKKYFYGKVSFVPESTLNVPSETFVGEVDPQIDSLRLIKCVYDEETQELNKQIDQNDDWRKHVTMNIKGIDNFVKKIKAQDPETLQFSKEMGISLQFYNNGNNHKFVGSFLQRENIQKFSPKLKYLIDRLLDPQMLEKSFIYFNMVNNIGTDLIETMLNVHGIIDFEQRETELTMCFNCKFIKARHNPQFKQCQNFIAYKYVAFTSIQKQKALLGLQRYNDPSNLFGQRIQIVVGSRIICQSRSIMATNRVYILSLPYNYPNLIQVLGRVSRTDSHSALPENKRYVHYYVLVNSNGPNAKQKSAEEEEYIKKYEQYKLIQEYERQIHECALDSQIYGEIFMKMSESKLMIQNRLKMMPYKASKTNKRDKDIHQMNYYLSEVDKDLNELIDQVLDVVFARHVCCHVRDVVHIIKNFPLLPTLSKVPDGAVILRILQQQKYVIHQEYIFKNSVQLQQNWFITDLGSMKHTVKLIENTKQDQDQSYIGYIFGQIQFLAPQYVENIRQMRYKKLETSVTIPEKKSNTLLQTIQASILDQFTSFQLIRDTIKAILANDYKALSVLFLVVKCLTNNDIEFNNVKNDQIVGLVLSGNYGVKVESKQKVLLVQLQKTAMKYGLQGHLENYKQKGLDAPVVTQLFPGGVFKIFSADPYQSISDKRKQSFGINCMSLKHEYLEALFLALSDQKTILKHKNDYCDQIKYLLFNLELHSRLQMENIHFMLFIEVDQQVTSQLHQYLQTFI